MAKPLIHKQFFLATTALCMGIAAPAMAQAPADDDARAASAADIIVTARRVEERLLDVPISITVFNQQQLTNNNVSNMKDLAAFTPGLNVNSRYGSDATNFTIRGFTQEQRTYATVGTYFADVVAPRGSGAVFGGDGAGPGALFDLQNVQVLKGPQGTLQGRNVTGGAVLLVPQKPTSRFEGYVEATVGDYNLRRIQAVVNTPIGDTFRLRLGLDRQTRDGYLRNIGRLGDGLTGNKGMGNVDYWAVRASAVADLTPNLENYTIATYTKTRSNGVSPKIVKCFPTAPGGPATNFIAFGPLCEAQKAREDQFDPWTVSNRLPDSASLTEQWQLINTTTWQASDSLTIKNIMSYGEFRSTTNLDLFGNYFVVNVLSNTIAPGSVTAGVPGTETSAAQVTGFAFTHANPYNNLTNAQSSFVEELQFQGRPGDGRFIWQAGGYVELNDPLGFSGIQSVSSGACADVNTLNCAYGRPTFQISESKFRDYAVYGQASYNFTDQLKLTAGLRYTWDKQISEIHIESINIATQRFSCLNPIGTGAGSTTYPLDQRLTACGQTLRKSTKAPTWTVGLDYKPMEDVLLYAKWSRGYRQGGLSLFSPDTSQPFNAEKVDAYEVGAKASWRGAMPGTFSIAAFHNNFKDQQLLLGVLDVIANPGGIPAATPSASIVNAGKSRMRGFETELTLSPFEGFRVNVAYSYLDTQLQQFVAPAFAAGSLYDTAVQPAVGGDIPNAGPDHKLVVQANYTLPLPESIGKVTLGGTYAYAASYRSVADACPTTTTSGCAGIANPGGGILPATSVVNLNVNWENIGGMPIDAGAFVTNLTKEVVYLQANDNTGRGFVSRLLGEPRMYGVRLKYRFGG